MRLKEEAGFFLHIEVKGCRRRQLSQYRQAMWIYLEHTHPIPDLFLSLVAVISDILLKAHITNYLRHTDT